SQRQSGDVIRVEFTVLGSPCLELNGRHSEAFSFQIATDNQAETDRGFRTQSSRRLLSAPRCPCGGSRRCPSAPYAQLPAPCTCQGPLRGGQQQCRIRRW